jgi:hypothetical protein
MENQEVVASRISDYVKKSPGNKVSGTDLAQYLKFSFPGFSPDAYGAPKLRVFVERYVPEVCVVGRSGTDPVYALRSMADDLGGRTREASSVAVPTLDPPPSPDFSNSIRMNHQIWKSFSSPNSLWHIYANTETGEIQAISPGGPRLSAPWVIIPPCAAEVHLQVAKGFVSTVSDAKQRESLQSLLAQPRWWDRIFAVLLQMNLLRNWQVYRRRELLKAFFEALRLEGVPVKQQISGQFTSPPPLGEHVPPKQLSGQAKIGSDERLRQAVLSVVEKMSVAELRALSIPVGYLVDELRRDG